jgi:hypothetical protein
LLYLRLRGAKELHKKQLDKCQRQSRQPHPKANVKILDEHRRVERRAAAHAENPLPE